MGQIEYDAIVIGAGATGGVAAYALAQRGSKVLVLDAGPQLNPELLQASPLQQGLERAWNLLTQRQAVQALHPGYWKAHPRFFVNEQDNPYSTPIDRPFYWTRGRQVGGRSLTWGGTTLRLSDYEFKAAEQDGYGSSWPLSHAELAPYYGELERFFQIHGDRDGLSQLPDGEYSTVPPLTPAEQYLKPIVQKHWSDRRVIVARGFPLHRGPGWPRSSSLGSSLKAALATGHVTLQPDAVVSHLVFNPKTRQAQGVEYIHRTEKTLRGVRGKVIILCASTIESVRILLHSTEQYQSGGLINASDLLGRNLMDHLSTMQFFSLPPFQQPDPSFDLSGCDSFFIPRFSNLGKPEAEFLRGYGLWGGIQRTAVPPAFSGVKPDAIGFMVGYGEVLPYADNRVSLSHAQVDAWGIPVPHIDCHWRENEQRMLGAMQTEIRAIVDAAGGRCLHPSELLSVPLFSLKNPPLVHLLNTIEQRSMSDTRPGYYIHEVGGAAMGTSAQNSVVNAWNQCWETPNVLVVDGACWPTAGWQNPTLTEMAIALRACRQIQIR